MKTKDNAIEWWENLSLEEQQKEMYLCCTSQEKSPFEFTIEDIINIYELNNENNN